MGSIDPPIPRKMPRRPKRCKTKKGTSAPISNGPTLITGNLVPTSGTSDQLGFQGETLISLPKRKKASKRKEINIDATIGTKESRNTNANVKK
ncbi:hypothetical protein GOBAR_DD21313 [Gossypium barbadense]|nr:hypothetical protein GOBAR_DD21313 [Gossypium barbadense]